MSLLIVANSGRLLARSAQRANLSVVSVDLFGDADVYDLVANVLQVQDFSLPCLLPALQNLQKTCTVDRIIIGSGLEAYPESLDWLGERFRILGNSPACWRRLHDKPEFFASLQKLGIAFPETVFSIPAQNPATNASVWLQKPYANAGGAHIRIASQQSNIEPENAYREQSASRANSYYWQRMLPGMPMSALFLADTERAVMVGINRQWTIKIGDEPFIFGGVLSENRFPQEPQKLLLRWLLLLTRELGLSGLNGLDFIWDGKNLWLLEINPRPPASMALYDATFPHGLLAAHIDACEGRLPASLPDKRIITGYQIVYAPHDFVFPYAWQWPGWAHDRPRGGSRIRAGQPICSIIADGITGQQCQALLRDRQNRIVSLLPLDHHAIHSKR